MSATTDLNNVCFTKLPDVKASIWPQDIWKRWLVGHGSEQYQGKDRQYIQRNWIYNRIYGTTFSGHPTRTTLGNTLRSIMYAFYYIQQAGIE